MLVGILTAAVFVTTLLLTWGVCKIYPKLRQYRIWHGALDDKLPHFPIHWFWGNVEQLKNFKEFWKKTETFINGKAKLYLFWIGFYRPVVALVHPETLEVILKSSEPKAKSGGGYEFLLPWLGDGLLVSDGEKWWRNRKLLTPAFHFGILQSYFPIYNRVANLFMGNLEKQSKGGKSVEVFGPARLAALDTMLRCTLSYESDIQENGSFHPYVKAVSRLSFLLLQRARNILHYINFIYFRSKPGREFADLCRYTHEFSEKIISARKQSLASNTDLLTKRHLDFLDILLSAQDEHGEGLTDGEIRDEVETFMFAGHDTTSAAISWCLYCLGKYPEEQKKVLQEVRDVVSDKDEIEIEDISKLNYLPLFIRETMRMYPPVPTISRQLSRSVLIDGVTIPKGVITDLNLYQMHRNPHVWENPLVSMHVVDHIAREFNTSRFEPDEFSKMNRYSFTPFSAGPRNCIGQNFALHEIKVILCHIVRRFEIAEDKSQPPEPIPEVVLRAENGLYVKFIPRH